MDTKITLVFRENEMKWIKTMLTEYYGSRPTTKKELKHQLQMFAATMFSKGSYAVEHDQEYMELK